MSFVLLYLIMVVQMSKTIRKLITFLKTKYVCILQKLYFFSEKTLFSKKYL